MNVLSVENLEKTVNDEPLFSSLTFGLEKGEKAAVVGRNGSGKSTLLKIISGVLSPDKGRVSINRSTRISSSMQDFSSSADDSIRSYFYSAPSPDIALLKKYNDAIAENDEKAYTAIGEEISQKGLWNIERDFYAKCEYFNLKKDPETPVSTLSGGEKRKLQLALAFSQKADLVLLDEPTNHLDIKTIEKLEALLEDEKLTVLLVTHDRQLIDNTCSVIYELDKGEFYRHEGTFLSYLENRREREEEKEKRQEKLNNILSGELKWLSRAPKARGGKDKNRKERIEKMLSLVEEKKKDSSPFFSLYRKLSKKVLEIENISKAWDGKTLFSGFSFSFLDGMRIGVIGDNGSGKSTLLDIIAGVVESDEGTVDKGSSTYISYYDQMKRTLKEDKSILEYFSSIAENIQTEYKILSADAFLSMFGFSRSNQNKRISTLSGGEKRRLYLISKLIENPNFLILDEPTNDLDLWSMENLEYYLSTFRGVSLICSHDRAFLEINCDYLFVIENQKISFYSSSYSAYKKSRAAEKDSKKREKETARREKREKKGLTYKEMKEKEELENTLSFLMEKKKALEESFTQAGLSYIEIDKNNRKYEEILRKEDEITDRILALMEKEEA